MPTYQYVCDPCAIVYETMHSMSAPPLKTCQKCKGDVSRMISAPMLNTRNYTSPTQATYAKLSESDEMKKEAELQKVYETIWVPPEVKHDPWDDDDDHHHH